MTSRREELEQQAQRLLERSEREGLQVIRLLITGRQFIDALFKGGRIEGDQARKFIEEVDELIGE
jgi:hypothetical protein